MPTRSPRRVEQLYFLLRREPTVRSTENLERRHSLSLKIKSHAHCIPSQLLPIFCSFPFEKTTIHVLSYSINNSFNSHHVPSSRFLALCNIYAVHFHHLSTHTTCVIWVYVVGDFFHITCLLNPFYGTRSLVPRKM